MKKKLSVMFLVILLCLSAALPVLAEGDAAGFSGLYYRVVDFADLLTESEETALIAQLDELSLRQNMDVIVATTDDLEGFSVRDYADILYDQLLFGYGENRDGLMLLISMEDHDWYISTTGYGITAFTDAGIQYIGEQIKSDLSAGNYAAAFSKYAELCDEFITQANTGKPYDSGNLPKKPLSFIWIPIAIVIGFVIAKIIVGSMKSQLKSVRAAAAANNYMKDGSLRITQSNDLFLYHTVTRTAKPKNNSTGSSTHTSSGMTHGGGGGKF